MTARDPGRGQQPDPGARKAIASAARRPAGDAPAQGRRSWWQHPARIHDVGENPDYRFTLANERTFLAWIRTALALLAGGVAVIKLVPSFTFTGGRHLLGIPLVVLSIALALSAYRHWAAGERAMRLQRPLPASPLPFLLGAAVAAISAIALFLLLLGTGQP